MPNGAFIPSANVLQISQKPIGIYTKSDNYSWHILSIFFVDIILEIVRVAVAV